MHRSCYTTSPRGQQHASPRELDDRLPDRHNAYMPPVTDRLSSTSGEPVPRFSLALRQKARRQDAGRMPDTRRERVDRRDSSVSLEAFGRSRSRFDGREGGTYNRMVHN